MKKNTELLKQLTDIMPFKLPETIIPYILELIELSQKDAISDYDTDLQEFAEWCGLHYDWNPKLNVWMNNKGSKTTSQLREMWKIETGRRGKA